MSHAPGELRNFRDEQLVLLAPVDIRSRTCASIASGEPVPLQNRTYLADLVDLRVRSMALQDEALATNRNQIAGKLEDAFFPNAYNTREQVDRDPSLLRDWRRDQPEEVIDFTPYDLPAQEPQELTRNWSLMNRLNQKGIRPQDRPAAFAELSGVREARPYSSIANGSVRKAG